MIEKLIYKLVDKYPDAKCSLDFTTPLELMVAVILSAQATDAMINKITPALFERFKTADDYANCDISELEKYIKSSGFYRNKAKNIKNACKIIVEKYNGIVPNTMSELTSLPGIGRKTANVILLNVFNKCEGIAIDTHAKRIANRIRLSQNTNPEKIEKDLLNKIPQKYWGKMNHLLVYHGRATCTARKPKCDECCISEFCEFGKQMSGTRIK